MNDSKLKNAYALLIGVGNDLPVSVGDAADVYRLLLDKDLAGYQPENVILLTNELATRNNILLAFDNLIAKVNEDSSVLLYYSGHGGTYSDNTFLKEKDWKPEIENQKYFHLCPYDYDPVNYETTWVKAEEVREKINALKSRRLIFFLDCCHAAGMVQNPILAGIAPSFQTNADGLAQNLDTGRGMSILSSCRADQKSYIMEGDSNSLYTKCMLEVLQGQDKKDYDDPFIRISEVVRYIFKKVPEIHPEQNPYANLQIYDDFIVSKIAANNAKNQSLVEPTLTNFEVEKAKKQHLENFRVSENANNLILFIHGFSGLAESTFGAIPSLLMDQVKLDGWDMIPVGYAENILPELGNNVWATTTDLQIIATYLTSAITHKYSKYKRIAIVAHSLGGLVAQETLLSLQDNELKKISHVLLFATPSAGISLQVVEHTKQENLKELNESGQYIKNLRSKWASKFNGIYPFSFKVVAATRDDFVTIDSCLGPFANEFRAVVEGNHFSIVAVQNKDSDSFNLIVDTLTNNTFLSQFSSFEEINITLGNYDEVIKSFLPHVNNLDAKGLEQLVFALEGSDRSAEALAVIENSELAKSDSNLLGIIGGRFKRNYLSTYTKIFGDNAIRYYKMGLDIAEAKNDYKQIYFQAINLAFLSVVYLNDFALMNTYAQKVLEALDKDPFNNLWKLATLGEVHMYLGDFEASKSYYAQAVKMAGIREKLSMYTNAYNAYIHLMNTGNQEDEFIKFLKKNFLS